MNAKQTIRCQNQYHGASQGNILCAISQGSIFIKCNDRGCHRWTKLTFNIPGINLDLSKAGIVQEVLPDGYHLTLEPATTVVASK